MLYPTELRALEADCSKRLSIACLLGTTYIGRQIEFGQRNSIRVYLISGSLPTLPTRNTLFVLFAMLHFLN
jgi:hypothetical protein